MSPPQRQWKALRETQTVRASCSKAEPKNSPTPQTPFTGAWDGQNFNQLQMVTSHYLYLQTHFLVRIDTCNFELSCNRPTHPPTNTARLPVANRQDQLQYTAPQLARSVIRREHTFLLSDATSDTVHIVTREYRMLSMSRNVLFDKTAWESSRLLCGVFCTCLDHSYVDITVSYKRWCTGSFLTLITTVIVAYMAYTRVMCASMHVLFPVRKFLLCKIAFTSGKLRIVLKIVDQSRAGSHFNSQNTHSQFRILPVPSATSRAPALTGLSLKQRPLPNSSGSAGIWIMN